MSGDAQALDTLLIRARWHGCNGGCRPSSGCPAARTAQDALDPCAEVDRLRALLVNGDPPLDVAATDDLMADVAGVHEASKGGRRGE